MGAPQKLKGRFRFPNEEALANAKEVLTRALADDWEILTEAFVFGDLEVTIDCDTSAPSAYYEPTTVVIAEMAAQALSGSVHCVYGSGSEKSEDRIRASGTHVARPLPPQRPLPTNDVEKVIDAVNRGKLDSLDMTKEQIGAAMWKALRIGKADLYWLLSSNSYPANEDAFDTDDLVLALQQHGARMADSLTRSLEHSWPTMLDRYFAMRITDAERIEAGTRDLLPAIRRLVDWSLARHGKLDHDALDPELLPFLAKHWLVAESYEGWERVYPRSIWNRAVIEAVLAGDQLQLMSDLERHFDDATPEEQVRLRLFATANVTHEHVSAIEKLGDGALPVLLAEAERLLTLMDDPARAHAKMEESRDNRAAWAMHAQCTHIGIALVRMNRLEERFEPLLVRSFLGVREIASSWDKNKALDFWWEAVRTLPEERRLRIYFAAGPLFWRYLGHDPIPALARSAIRFVASLPTELSLPPMEDGVKPDDMGYRLGNLGSAWVPFILETMRTKGAKRREALAMALAVIRGPEAKAALKSLRNDKGKKVRDIVERNLASR